MSVPESEMPIDSEPLVGAQPRRRRTRALRPVRRRVPDRADRHGLGGGAAATRGHVQRRRARHPRVGDDDARRARGRDRRGARRAPTSPFGVNLRADQPDAAARIELCIRRGVKVATFAQAPGEGADRAAQRRRRVVIATVGARRHAEKVAAWGVDAVIAQGGEGGGHTGPVPTIAAACPQVVDAVDIPVVGAGGFFDGRGPGRRARLRRRAASRWARASC